MSFVTKYFSLFAPNSFLKRFPYVKLYFLLKTFDAFTSTVYNVKLDSLLMSM